MLDLTNARSLSELPVLNQDEIEDAEFQGKDLAWAEATRLFALRKEADRASYESVANRIGRSKQEVGRWLSTSMRMSIKALGLLAEGLDADLVIRFEPRKKTPASPNYVHLCDVARERLTWVSLPFVPVQSIKTLSGVRSAKVEWGRAS